VTEALAFAHRQGKALRVLAAESNPGGEGRAVVTELSRAGISAELISDDAVPSALEQADLGLTGADWISLTAVTNKVGTAALCRAAQDRGKPVYCFSSRLKMLSFEPPPDRTGLFEPTPIEAFTAIVTEDGVRRTFRRDGANPKVDLNDPLEPHRRLVLELTDRDMHDVTAFLAALK
jgi:translation initiation factor 2B subunit (eIF-2B alpha/beta/delta family)